MATLFDFLKKAFDGIGCADEPPVFLGKEIKGQAFGQITAETIAGGQVGLLILEEKRSRRLLGLFQIVLIENGSQFRIDLLLLLGGDVAQDVLHFVPNAALAFGVQKLVLNGVDHGFAAIANPQVHRLQSPIFAVRQQGFPG